VAGLATIAPWTVRNALVYRRFIPLDTGASYSLWAFYEPREELDEVNRTLEAIPNPADRQAYASAKWRERLQEDPMILLRKVRDTFPYLVRVKPIEDRFLPLPYHEPGVLYFALALLLDDGLYALIAVAGLAALLFAPNDRGKALALLWLLYNVAVLMVLHAEARYRQLLFPVLIPYAGLALAQGRRLFVPRNSTPTAKEGDRGAQDRKGPLYGRWVMFAVLLAGWAYCFIVYSPWEWAALNLQRGFHQAWGHVNWALGRPDAALAAYERAVQVDERNPESYYDWGWALQHLGRLEEAAKVYRWGWDTRSHYLPCSTALGSVLRQLGEAEEARQAFRGRYVDEKDVVAWAWEHLDIPPGQYLDVGDGLDYGYLAGVHATESAGGVTFRWTTASAQLRLIPTQSGQTLLRLRLAAPRLGSPAPPLVQVWLGRTLLGKWEVSPGWGSYETAPFPVQAGQRLELALRSATFVPAEIEPASSDTRSLGVQLDWAELVTGITGESPEPVYNASTPFP
jgi:tetratricopeptide (TPR) repeat protein